MTANNELAARDRQLRQQQEGNLTIESPLVHLGFGSIFFAITVWLLSHRPNADDPEFSHLTPEQFRHLQDSYDYEIRENLSTLGISLIAFATFALRPRHQAQQQSAQTQGTNTQIEAQEASASEELVATNQPPKKIKAKQQMDQIQQLIKSLPPQCILTIPKKKAATAILSLPFEEKESQEIITMLRSLYPETNFIYYNKKIDITIKKPKLIDEDQLREAKEKFKYLIKSVILSSSSQSSISLASSTADFDNASESSSETGKSSEQDSSESGDRAAEDDEDRPVKRKNQLPQKSKKQKKQTAYTPRPKEIPTKKERVKERQKQRAKEKEAETLRPRPGAAAAEENQKDKKSKKTASRKTPKRIDFDGLIKKHSRNINSLLERLDAAGTKTGIIAQALMYHLISMLDTLKEQRRIQSQHESSDVIDHLRHLIVHHPSALIHTEDSSTIDYDLEIIASLFRDGDTLTTMSWEDLNTAIESTYFYNAHSAVKSESDAAEDPRPVVLGYASNEYFNILQDMLKQLIDYEEQLKRPRQSPELFQAGFDPDLMKACRYCCFAIGEAAKQPGVLTQSYRKLVVDKYIQHRNTTCHAQGDEMPDSDILRLTRYAKICLRLTHRHLRETHQFDLIRHTQAADLTERELRIYDYH